MFKNNLITGHCEFSRWQGEREVGRPAKLPYYVSFRMKSDTHSRSEYGARNLSRNLRFI